MSARTFPVVGRWFPGYEVMRLKRMDDRPECYVRFRSSADAEFMISRLNGAIWDPKQPSVASGTL